MPCSDCHEKGDPINREVRELEDEHDEMDFEHGDLWCLDCHDAEEQGMLRRSGGELVELEDSWRLCTQCHVSGHPGQPRSPTDRFVVSKACLQCHVNIHGSNHPAAQGLTR